MAITYGTSAAIIPAQVLARGSLKRATIDLSTVPGAKLAVRIGRSDATAIASTAGLAGVSFRARRLWTISGVVKKHPSGVALQGGTTAAVVGRVNNGAGYAAGTSTMTVDGTSLVPAAGVEVVLCLWGTATDPTTLANGDVLANCEFCRLSKATTTSLTVDSPSELSHPDNDYITTQADVFNEVWIDGGDVYEVIFDYGDDTSGSNVAIECLYQTLTKSG